MKIIQIRINERMVILKKKLLASLCVLCCTMFAGTALAAGSTAAKDEQCFTKDQLTTLNKENVAHGQGTLYGQFSFTRDKATPEQAIKEIGWMTLKKGASIGLHKHAVNADSYIIISGEGIFTDGSGKETIAKAGSITLARPGQSHALRNETDEPLVFLDVIAQNDTYQQNHPEASAK